MPWHGANTKRFVTTRTDKRVQSQRHDIGHQPGAPEQSNATRETVEAALNRLTKAYAIAMECVGVCHRSRVTLDTASSTDLSVSDLSSALVRSSRAARTTFEACIFHDAMIQPHVPAWIRANAEECSHSSLHSVSYVPLTSASHQATVLELSYLSLINYADLLLAGLPATRHGNSHSTERGHVLDRGVIQPFLDASLWVSEAPPNAAASSATEPDPTPEPWPVTVRLAMTAYLDATALDGTDPTAWIKLACAARRLGRLSARNDAAHIDTAPWTPWTLRHRRLERYALERAVAALPPHEPGNRLARQALEEWYQEEDAAVQYLPPTVRHLDDPPPLFIELSRYSWSTLGRLLLRVCKEGSMYAVSPSSRSMSIKTGTQAPVTSIHAVRVQVSPLLTLPMTVLARVVSWLDATQSWRLEATCRSLSSSVLSARAVLDNVTEATHRQSRLQPNVVPTLATTIPLANTEPDNSTQALLSSHTMDMDAEHPVPAPVADEGAVLEREETVKRVSKRVQSQMINSGKRAERSGRRNSAEYCLLGATLGCTASSVAYQRLLQQGAHATSGLGPSFELVDSLCGVLPTATAATTANTVKVSYMERFVQGDKDATVERMSASSLSHFLEHCNLQPIPPVQYLCRFVAHISMYISPVFSSDSHGSLVLSTCLLDCIAMIAQRTISKQDLCTCWSTSNRNNVPLSSVELFALDLLHGELRLKKCEAADVVTFEYDGDCHLVSTLVPILVGLVDDVEHENADPGEKSVWNALKTRCYWLAASFYLWRSKISCDVVESRTAEREGLEWIDQTEQCLRNHDTNVPTPHLTSPSRHGLHWKELSVESLAVLKDEIQASSIVLLAQEQYLKATSRRPDSDELPNQEEDAATLLSIGESLLARYSCPIDAPEAKYAELIDDFMGVHGDELLTRAWSKTTTEGSESTQSWFDGLLPFEKREDGSPRPCLSDPCVLSVLVSCLQTKQEHAVSIAQLLVRLVCVLADLTEGISSRMKLQSERMNQDSSSFDDFDEDEDSIMSDDSVEGDANMDGSADTRRLRQHATLLPLMITKLCALYRDELSNAARISLIQAAEFSAMLKRSLFFAANWFSSSRLLGHKMLSLGEDLSTVLACQAILQSVSVTSNVSEVWMHDITRTYVGGLFQIVMAQRRFLAQLSRTKPSAHGRSERLRTTRKQADLVAAVCCDVGFLMTQYPVSVERGRMKISSLFTDEKANSHAMTRLATFCDALLWFWGAAIFADGTSLVTNENSAHLTSYIDAFARERLRVPVATAIIGFLGSAASSFPRAIPDGEVSLVEFCDSDASAMEEGSSESEVVSERNAESRELLRVIMQIVHCASCVFSKVDEKEACRFAYVKGYVSDHGPCLPLVVARVLNRFALHLLVDYKGPEQTESQSKWSDYPVGARTVGTLLDSVLYRAYKCLHGFSLTRDTKETAVSNVSHNVKHLHQVLPENKEAAAMLYRCMTRAYSQGRRSPPKAALDIVRAALPPTKDSQTSEAIRNYILSDDISNVSTTGLLSLVGKRGSWESSFSFIETVTSASAEASNDVDIETTIVYRGLSKLIAQGPIPRYQETSDEKEWRACTAQTEEDLSIKFSAIIDDLCFGDISDSSGWFKASQCLSMKADLIADRVGLTHGFLRNPKFATECQGVPSSTYDLSVLDSMQERDEDLHDQSWLPCLGSDLSCFIRYNWSSFDSLRRCSAEISRSYREIVKDGDDEDHEMLFRTQVSQEIHELLHKKDLVRWQEAWGGLFVSSLRIAAYRCISLALFMSHSKVDPTPADNLLRSEILESLGLNLYTELAGSQSYGYPMKAMPVLRKRKLAEAAMACFEQAVELQLKDDNSSDIQPPWDLSLMIGKCREKIAKVYDREAFAVAAATGGEALTRRYEFHMKLALQSYATSVQQAQEIEKDGGFVEQHGGSAHGAVEAVYRLHASRLKCLISAVDRKEDERDAAEWEALRLTECHWYAIPDSECVDKTLRERVWIVLVDVVAALAKCSQDYSFFHRSVYRHAQALLWAPVLCNPVQGHVSGSLGTVPATLAGQIRGLDDDAAMSAASVLGSLFTKKRAHLVSAWVTGDGTASAFQALNAAVRKYDSLRGKYIAGYLDCLRLCRKRKELDTFLSWTMAPTCPRDLPSYFGASALNQGGKPTQSQVHDTLLKGRSGTLQHFLTSVRREANGALAHTVGQDLHDDSEIPTKPADQTKYFETQLKVAYACFLRLNCTLDDLLKSRSWKYDRKSGIKDVVEVVSAAYLKVEKPDTLAGLNSSWSVEAQVTTLFQKAVRKCKELYPTLSSNFSFSRQRAPKKKATAATTPASTGKRQAENESTAARSSPLTSFEVAIPQGLSEGETFLTSIPYGEGVKKLRLTVPAGEASSVQFTLPVPTSTLAAAPTSENAPSSTAESPDKLTPMPNRDSKA